MDFQKLYQHAQQIQSRLMAELEQTEVEGDSGGGMVRARMNGKKNLLSVTIDPEILRDPDREMLQNLVVAAVNQCARKVDELLAEKLGGLAGRMNLPGLFGG
jgi:hypothetical protein